MASLFAQVYERKNLNSREKLSMFELYRQYYGAVQLPQFLGDLEEKDIVILLRDSSGRLCGFSTVLLIEFEFAQQARRALFSGDTVIHHEHWGTQVLSLAWCRLAGTIKQRHPKVPLYWFLIVKGYRTYRYLPLFAKTFYPTWRESTPDEVRQIMDHLAVYKFGDAYKPDRGIVHFAQSQGHLQGHWADVPPHVAHKPDVRFFLQSNPGFVHGDELVCFAELMESNLRSHALRAFKEAQAC